MENREHPQSPIEETPTVESKVREKFEQIKDQKVQLDLALMLAGTRDVCVIVRPDRPITVLPAREVANLAGYKEVIDGQQFIFAKDDETLQKLKDILVIPQERNEEHLKGMGHLLGYPDTAVEAFVQGQTADESTLPQAVTQSRLFRYVNFKLSQEHWKDELKQFIEKIEKIKSIAPQVYDDITSGIDDVKKELE